MMLLSVLVQQVSRSGRSCYLIRVEREYCPATFYEIPGLMTVIKVSVI